MSIIKKVRCDNITTMLMKYFWGKDGVTYATLHRNVEEKIIIQAINEKLIDYNPLTEVYSLTSKGRAYLN